MVNLEVALEDKMELDSKHGHCASLFLSSLFSPDNILPLCVHVFFFNLPRELCPLRKGSKVSPLSHLPSPLHSFNKCLLSTYCVLGPEPGFGVTAGNTVPASTA